MELPTKKGPVRLAAERFSYSLLRRTAVARDAALYAPGGERIARAGWIELQAPRGADPAYRVRAGEVEALLERTADGRWKHLDLLPETQERRQPVPVELRVESARIGLLDRTAARPRPLWVDVRNVRVDGFGDRWLASGEAQAAGYGALRGLVRVAPEVGVGFNLTAEGLNAAGLLNALEGNWEARRFAELKRYRAGSAVFTGSVRGHVSPAGALAFDASGKLDAAGLELAGRRLERVSFVGSADEASVRGAFEGQAQGLQASFAGRIFWQGGLQAFGRVSAQAPGSRGIPRWVSEYLPRELNLGRSRFDGWFSLDKGGRPALGGTVRADEAEWAGERLSGAQAKLYVDPRRVLIEGLAGRWMGSPLEGDIAVRLDTGALSGLFKAKHVNLASAAKRVGLPNASGWANAAAAVSGTTGAPVVDVRANATASARVYGSPKVYLGNVEFAGRYAGGKLHVQRFAAAGRNGVFVAKGRIDLDASRLDLELDGNGVRLEEFNPELKGTGLFRLAIKGSPERPVATGQAEIVGAEAMGYQIPFAGGSVLWDSNGVLVRNLIAVKGATTVRGYVAWSARDQQLDGELAITDVILSDWLGDEASGSLSVRRASLRGSLDNPVLSASGSGSNLVVYGARIDGASFRFHLTRNALFLSELSLKAGKGRATASGYLDFRGSGGALSGEAEDLPLGRLIPHSAEAVSVDGTLSGKYIATFDGLKLSILSSSGTLRDVTVNGALLGSGDWSARGVGGLWTASLMVGQIERYIELDMPFYDQNDQALRGSLTAYNIDAGTLVEAFKRYLPKDDLRLAQRLEALKGDVGLSAALSVDRGETNLQISNATIERLALDQQDLGRISLNASRQGRLWTIKELIWQKDGQRAAVSGTIDEKGDLALDGEVSNLKNSLLRAVLPDLPNLTGSIDLLSFSASGPTRSPVVQASLRASNVGVAADGANPEELITTDVNLTNVSVEEGSVKAEGWIFYKGIRGEVRAELPFRYPLEIPQGEPIRGSLTLATNQLEAFLEYVPNLSPVSSGLVTGKLALSGSVDRPELNGEIKVDAPVLAFQGVDTFLKDVRASLALKNNEATFRFGARPDKGGSIEALGAAKDIDLAALAEAPSKVLALPLEGYVNFKDAKVHQNGNKYGAISFVADGRVGIGGSIRSPLFQSSGIALKEVNGVAPSEFAQQPVTERPEIDPRFDIRFDVLPGARARAANAEVYIYGSGNLSGSLFRPSIQANFTLTKGSLKLPNARIQLHDGGSMRFSYRVDPEGLGQARMDVDLHGSTNVTAVRYGDTVDRYAIDLRMRGDILEAGNLQITAQSDPPDLSQERILSILGQGDFFQGLAQGNKSAIASFALPTVLDPVTSTVAKNFGLEYLTVEYDLQRRTTVTAARVLGSGFTLMGRRQVSPPTFGKELYEFKLSYRLPFNNAALRSFTLSLGTDQDHPWKFTIEYGRRF